MRYRRERTPGTSYFFTVNLAERKSRLLIDEIDKLKSAFRVVKATHPFKIDAMVVLPDHMHVIMSLPWGDANYSKRWSLIKGCFSRQINVIERYIIEQKT